MKLTGVANAIRIAAAKLSTDVAVRPLSTEVSAQDERIAASIVASNIQAGIVPVRLNAAILVSPVQLAYALGLWLSHSRYGDGFGVLDKSLLAFFKTKTENLSLAEEVTAEFLKGLKETLSLSDKAIFSLFRGLVDDGEVSDQYSMFFERSVDDSAKIQDSLLLSPSKYAFETVCFVDLKSFLFTRLLTESPKLSDVSFRSSVKGLNEAPQFTDALKRVVSKSLFDRLNVDEELDGGGGFKQKVESARFSDLKTFASQKTRSELIAISDFGSLISQGYCDFSYFESDFVGKFLTF